MTDATGTTLYEYDQFDRLTGIDYPDGNFIRYGHDEVGNVTDLQYGNWLTVASSGTYTYVQYAYDPDNRIQAFANIFTGHLTSYQYDKAVTLPDGTCRTGATRCTVTTRMGG